MNEKISIATLAMPKPQPGTRITNRIDQTHYAVDENWNRVGPVVSRPTISVTPPNTDPILSQAQTDPNDENRFPYRLVAFLLACVAAAVTILLLVRSRARDRN